MITAIIISSVVGFGLGFGFHNQIVELYLKSKSKIKEKL